MKSKIFSLLVCLVAVMLLPGCDDWEPGQNKFAANTGGLNLGDMAVDVRTDTSLPSRAGIDTSGYLVTITDETGATVVYADKECAWKYSEMPEVMTLPVGKYIVNVSSHKVEKAAWDAPLYEGSKEFEIKDGEITAIGSVVCRFASIKVSVRFADDLASAMSADSKADVVAGDEGSLTWTADETRTGYFEAVDGSTTLVATFTGTVKGQTITRTKPFTDVAKGKYYIITFSLKTGPSVPDETGYIDPTGGITVDSEISESDENGNADTPEEPQDPSGRPDDEVWPDNPDNPDDPVDPGTEGKVTVVPIPDENGNSGIDPDFNKVNDAIDGRKYAINIKTTEPMTHLHVVIQSDYLTNEFLESVGLSSTFDLAEPGEFEEALNGFGFPVGDNLIGKTDIDFDLSPFIPLLNLGDPMVHTFILTVEAENGIKESFSLKFQSF